MTKAILPVIVKYPIGDAKGNEYFDKNRVKSYTFAGIVEETH